MDMTGYGLLSSGRHRVNRQECESLGYTREETDWERAARLPHGFHSLWLYTVCGLVRIARSDLDAWADAVNKGQDTTRAIQVTVLPGEFCFSHGPNTTMSRS